MPFTLVRRLSGFVALFSLAAPWAGLPAAPLSKSQDVDFFRDVPSRNLKGFATRSDGRLVAGPTLTDLEGTLPVDLLWSLSAAGENRWIAGTGPDGKVLEITLKGKGFTTREIADLDEAQIYFAHPLNAQDLLVGTSPGGALYLLRDGKVLARVAFSGESLLDAVILPGASASAPATTALVATGNPGRIYKIDLAALAKAGVNADRVTDLKLLAPKGVSLFGEIRDRNVRRIARLTDGRIVAGSAPKGNVYVFPATGGTARVLQENREAEVTDLLPRDDGSFYAAVTFTSTPAESRLNRGPRTNPASGAPTGAAPGSSATLPSPLVAPDPDVGEIARQERFSGRGQLLWFPANGFPETLLTRTGTAFYRLAAVGDRILIAGGEQGELIAFDPAARRSLTLTGSASAQLNTLAAASDGNLLLARNNPVGLASLDPSPANTERQAETRRLDLGTPTLLGQVRVNRLRGLDPAALRVEARTSYGSDEVEGWSDWTALSYTDGAWFAPDLRGRYLRLRFTLPAAKAAAAATAPEIDKAIVHHLPQNRRPVLVDFRIISPNFALIARPETPLIPSTTLGALLGPDRDTEKGNTALLASPVVLQPGAQIVYWSVTDPDGDDLTATFSLRREGADTWSDVAVDTHNSYAQFDLSTLADGVYFTRLIATEQAPRTAGERLSVTFETDDLIVDRTPPEIVVATALRQATKLIINVQGRDTLSQVDGVELVFNNGHQKTVEQPADGILDGKAETFVLELPADEVAGATAVEATLYDAAGNSSAKRIEIPHP